MSSCETVCVFQVLSHGPPSVCPPLLPCWPLPRLSDQASCYQSGREQTRDAGDVGDAKESLQDRKPTQRLWEAPIFRGKGLNIVTLHCLLHPPGWVLFHGLTSVVGDGGQGDLKSPKIGSPCACRGFSSPKHWNWHLKLVRTRRTVDQTNLGPWSIFHRTSISFNFFYPC